ncbi:Rpn family recombination-promoting nuclease/putative transposase [uncultured Fibrella sp.]|uniref:Rpn family recombination-promoting nuclease/putative transposase n=1 Tax=uncultured Fibrella sp. TaxID=1284596 RepID=UPI0035CA5EE1
MTGNTDNPHDRYFKETFSQIDILADFLNVYLPAPLRDQLERSSLVREFDTYTDETLSEHFADLVFSATLGDQKVRIVLLLEHKSYTEPYIHLQLNRYMLNAWDDQLARKKPLLPIIPIVVYHGRRRWKKRGIHTYFEHLPATASPYVPSFDYVLIDLSTILDHLPGFQTDYAKLTGVLLKTSRERRGLEKSLRSLAESINRLLTTEQGEQFFRTSLIYLSWVTALTKIELVTIFRDVSKQAENYNMSLYEQLIQEGIERGIEQGIERGVDQTNRKAIKAMLKLNMDTSLIATALELPVEQVKAHIQEIEGE